MFSWFPARHVGRGVAVKQRVSRAVNLIPTLMVSRFPDPFSLFSGVSPRFPRPSSYSRFPGYRCGCCFVLDTVVDRRPLSLALSLSFRQQ